MDKIFLFIMVIGLLSCSSDQQQPYDESRELVPNPEGYKKDSFVTVIPQEAEDICNFDKYLNDEKTPELAKRVFLNKEWNLNEDEKALALLDSLMAKNKEARPFYFKVVTLTEKKSDGYFSEGLGLMGKEYVENNTEEFARNFEKKDCFSDADLKTWVDIVLGEFSIIAENDNQVFGKYIKKLKLNAKNFSESERETVNRFCNLLIEQWKENEKKYSESSGN